MEDDQGPTRYRRIPAAANAAANAFASALLDPSECAPPLLRRL